jgi:hypothetical protein
VADRLRELSGLEQILQTNAQGVETLAETRIAKARADLSDGVTRVRDLAAAEESAQGIRRRLLGSLEEKLGALGALQLNRISSLLGEATGLSVSSGSSLNANMQSKKGTSFKV